MNEKKNHKFKSTKDLFLQHDFIVERAKAARYVNHEFQDYGYRLAVKLDDLKHKALYIKLAKNEKRPLLDQALSFTLDYPKAKNKARIFMWKLKELRAQVQAKKADEFKNAKTLKMGI